MIGPLVLYSVLESMLSTKGTPPTNTQKYRPVWCQRMPCSRIIRVYRSGRRDVGSPGLPLVGSGGAPRQLRPGRSTDGYSDGVDILLVLSRNTLHLTRILLETASVEDANLGKRLCALITFTNAHTPALTTIPFLLVTPAVLY